MSQIDKVVSRLGDQLTDELVLHAVPAFHLGGAREIVTTGFKSSGWFIAAAVAGKIDGTDTTTEPGPLLPLPQRCIVAVTTRRLLIFSSSYWVNSPVKLLHGLKFGDLAWLREPVPDGRVAKSERVIVGLASGAMLGWEFPRLSIAPGRALLADLARGVSGSLPDDGT